MKSEESKETSLKEAISKFVYDGCSITFGGFCGRNSQAAAYEIVRQRKRNLSVIDDSPTDLLDILIGAGCINAVQIAWQSVSIFARAANFRRSVENGIPTKVSVDDYSNYSMGLRFLAGALGIPFMPTKSLLGSDIPAYNNKIKIIEDPYEGKPVALVPAASPDLAIIHVQHADQEGNAQIWGHLANDENKARAAKRTILTCEQIVSSKRIRKNPNMTIIPSYCVKAVIQVPYGSHPWSCYGYYYHDVVFQRDYANQSESLEGFLKWLEEWVLSCNNHDDYCRKVGKKRLKKLSELERQLNRIEV
jgi:glutaconate CoA-transferase subunit A